MCFIAMQFIIARGRSNMIDMSYVIFKSDKTAWSMQYPFNMTFVR